MTSRALFREFSGRGSLLGSSLKELFLWGNHLKVGQASIDLQHEAIFKIAMEIADAWKTHEHLDHLRALARNLAKVLGAHFQYEEKQLAEIGYPKYEEHKREHELLLSELEVIRDRLDHFSTAAEIQASGFLVYHYVLGVTVGHILGSDIDYCAFAQNTPNLTQKMSTPSSCPFCGSTETETFECDAQAWAVSCGVCLAIGPRSNSVANAVSLWSRAKEATQVNGMGSAFDSERPLMPQS